MDPRRARLHPRLPRKFRRRLKRAARLLLAPALGLNVLPSGAEVIRDGSIGPASGVQPSGPDFQIPEEHGARHGANLFHSFKSFDLQQHESATFSGSAAIQNIVGRITGPKASHIDGTVRSTIPGANLYLLNPHGILFGPNAGIDVHGAFHAGAATALQFSDGKAFEVAAAAPALTVASPEAFGFLGAVGGVAVNGATLASFHDIYLGGTSVELRDGAIVGTPANGTQNGGKVSLYATDHIALSGVDVASNPSRILTSTSSAGAAGDIYIDAPIVSLADAASVGSITTGTGDAGQLRIAASTRVTLRGKSTDNLSAALTSVTGGDGNAGDIYITTPTLHLEDGSIIAVSSVFDGEGAAGRINIRAAQEVSLSGHSDRGIGSFLQAATGGHNAAGGIQIETPRLTLRDGASISTVTLGSGTAGKIDIRATEYISLSGHGHRGSGSYIDSSSLTSGAAGNINLHAPVITLDDGAWISVTAHKADSGAVGTLSVTATASLTLSGSDRNDQGPVAAKLIAANLSDRDVEPGRIQVSAPVIKLEDGASITAVSVGEGKGAGAEIDVRASERIILSGQDAQGSGASIEADTQNSARDGGKVYIETPQLEFTDGASIVSATRDGSTRGQIHLKVSERLSLSGAQDFVDLPSRISAHTVGSGAASHVRIDSPTITLADGAYVRTDTRATGDGGLIEINTKYLSLAGFAANGTGSHLGADSLAAGRAGDIVVDSDYVEINNGAFISTSTAGPGPGGNINVRARERFTLSGTGVGNDPSAVIANAIGAGRAGTIRVQTPHLSLTDGALLASANLGQGDAGAIELDIDRHLQLKDNAIISTLAEAGAGGNIRLRADGRVDIIDSHINTSVRSGEQRGGDIDMEAKQVILNGARIHARADRGHGGAIRLRADAIVRSDDSEISAAAGPAGIDGPVTINAPQFSSDDALTALPADYVDPAALLGRNCGQHTPGTNRFVVAPRRGLPLSPDGLLMAFDTLGLPGLGQTAARAPVDVAPGLSAQAGLSALRAGQFEHARRHWHAAAAGYAARGEGRTHGHTLRGLAHTQQALGQYGLSVQTLRRALTEAEQAGDPAGVAAALAGLGNAYLALGEADTARALLIRAARWARQHEHAQLGAVALINLGNHYATQGAYDEALAAYQAGARLARGAGRAQTEAQALNSAARSALRADRPALSHALLRRAETVLEHLLAGQAADQTQASLLIHLARTYQELAQGTPASKRPSLRQAYNALRRAQALSDRLQAPRLSSYALGSLGRLYQTQGRWAEALYLTRRALAAAERADAADALYRWHRQEGQILRAQDRPAAALAAYRRAVRLLEQTRPETLSQYDDRSLRFRQGVAPVYLELVDLLLHQADRQADAQALLAEARTTVEQLKGAELRDYFQDPCITELQAKQTRLEQVAPRAAVVYPILLPQRLELLVSLPDGLRRFPVAVGAEPVRRAAQRLRFLLQALAQREEYLALSQQLYQWLVQPYAQALHEHDIDTLVFVPGGVLRTLPLAALHDGQGFLIEHYRLAVTPSLALTDPKPFARHRPRLLLAGLSEAVQGWPALPNVPTELQAVRRYHGGRLLLDREFTLARMQQNLAQPDLSVLHIASHGQFTGQADSSFLLTYDGRLSMAHLNAYVGATRFRDQPLELLVLSACETAAGDERAALGLAGVAVKAGARSALGSLWGISDQATAVLIDEFYRQLRDPKVSKAQALQRAQRKLLADARFRHPFYWSAFLLINNWL